MVSKIIENKWLIIKLAVTVSVAIPIVITAYEVVTSDKESVVFLGNYDPIVGILIIIYYVLIIVLVVASGIFWLVKQIKFITNLKKEKAQTELLHLQSQVNPHFFFNMLNNLYGLVGTDAKKAQALILKLSDMMRYSIYEGEKDVIALKDEVEYLKNYIELHQMRYHKKIDVRFTYTIQEGYKVTPLLFLILLENSFKHGVENLRENAYVQANMTANVNKIYFEIENNFDPEIGEKPGIGLKNLKRRLELAYPNKHNFSIAITDNVYKTQLMLNKL